MILQVLFFAIFFAISWSLDKFCDTLSSRSSLRYVHPSSQNHDQNLNAKSRALCARFAIFG